MKILIVTSLYPPHFVGGYEIKCKLHADELSRRGHDVFVLAGNWKANDNVAENGVYRVLHSRRSRHSSNPQQGQVSSGLNDRIDQLKWAFSCRENYKITRDIIAELKPDLVYVWQLTEVSLSPVLAAQDRGIPIVYRLDDYWLSNLRKDLCLETNPLKRKFRAWVIGLTDFNSIDFRHIFVVSDSVKKTYMATGFLESSMTVLPEGVPAAMVLDVNAIPSPAVKDRVRLLYVGRLVPEKGVHVAVKSLAYLIDNLDVANVHLDIIGSGSSVYTEQLKTLTFELGLENHVDFVGFLDHQLVLARFPVYDAVLIPSLWEEPLSGTIAEAMARGLPAIATDRGGTAEIIADGENGLLVPPEDHEKLAAAIKRLVSSPSMSRQIRLKGIDTVNRRFTHEKIIDQVEHYFRNIVFSDRPCR